MNKAELVAAVAEKAGLTKKNAAAALDAIVETVSASLARGDSVQLVGFGTFKVQNTAARTGRNPQTGKEIDIPASKRPVFKPGKSLKNAVT